MTVADRAGSAAVPAPREEEHLDTYHGVEVSDPYRWMEDLSDPELAPWLEAQQQRTHEVLGRIPLRSRFSARLAELLHSPATGVPHMRGGRWFQSRLAAGDDRPVIHVSDKPGGDGRIVLDPRELPEDVMVADVEPSPDGTLLLWSTSSGGSDWKHWHVTDVDSGAEVDAAVNDAKLWGTWLPDGSGFLYVGFPPAGSGRFRPTNVPQLRLHQLGASQRDDTVIFEDTEQPRYFFARFSDDGRLLVLTFIVSGGGEIACAEHDGAWRFQTLVTAATELWCIGGTADELLVVTEEGAPNGRVVAIDRDHPEPEHWRSVVAENELPLRIAARAAKVGDWVVAIRERIGRSVVTMHRVDGADAYEVDLPPDTDVAIGDIAEPVGAAADGSGMCIGCTSPTNPSLLVWHDIAKRQTGTLHTSPVAPSLQLASELTWAVSADGTRVPMTLVGAAAALQRGDAPVLIQGYGGAGDSMEPFGFEAWKTAWMEHGGIVASAHIRGGNELGARWRRAAERTGKVRAMEDFMACAQALRERGVPVSRVAITGRSSGAMLASAAALTRPDLFAAVVAEVGMFDPYRYHLFGLGRLMVSEYGISEDPDDFAAMQKISPLQLAQKPGTYPAFLITVHTDDDRVAPGGAYKFAATLQRTQQGDAPILLRLRSGAGHHGGSAAGEVEERADILAFLTSVLEQT